MKSKFMEDLHGEGVLGEFLDKFLYGKLQIQEFTRNSRLKLDYMEYQFKGIDITFTFNGTDYIVDEKATLQYPDGIPTFAFELKYKKNNQWREGWFYDESKATRYYLLTWPIRNPVELSDLQVNDIRKVEVMLISRKELQDYLFKNYQIDRNVIQGEVDNIIKAQKFRKLHTIHPTSNHYYYYTEYLAETPINLVIQKNTLKDLAIFHFNIYRDKPYIKNTNSTIWLRTQFQ